MRKLDIEVINDIDECSIHLRMLRHNLTLVRLGLNNKDFIPNPEVVDNAIYVVEEEMDRIADTIDKILF